MTTIVGRVGWLAGVLACAASVAQVQAQAPTSKAPTSRVGTASAAKAAPASPRPARPVMTKANAAREDGDLEQAIEL